MTTDTIPKKNVAANVDDQPWWYAQCLLNIQNLPGGGGTMCPDNHCDNTIIKQYAEAYCNCTSSYPNGCVPVQNPPANCCSYSAVSPLPVMSDNCYCCCGCFANNTPVAFDKDQYKAIVDYQIGDLVYVADDINLKSFSQRQVLWSAGTGDEGAENPMLRITFGSPTKNDYLLVNRAQLFLVPGAKLKPAGLLIPGQDALVASDGSPRQVLSLEVGTFKKGLHHIATSTKAATSPDGHLILAKNIVAGDWALQVGLSTQSRSNLSLADGVESLPEFGTKEYEQSVASLGLEVTPYRVAVAGLPGPTASDEEFVAFDEASGAYIPENAFSFLTPDQAYDVAGGPATPPAAQAGKQNVLYLFKIFGAFYPTVKFYYDEQNLTPNSYFFEEYGVTQLVITGGLARVQAIKYEGMALIIATMIGAIASPPPFNDQGFSCLGVASYSAVGSTLPNVWIGMDSVPIFHLGLAQITEVFSYVQTSHQGGGDTCMNVSLDCRIQAMNNAFELLPLPACAGGPPDPALDVTGATGNVGVPHGHVTVTFNLNVDPITGSQPANYALEPLAPTFEAKISPTDPKSVVVIADLKRATKYELTVTGVLSDQQQPLLPGENTAIFTTKG
jgi:hypothetical protein